MDLVWEPLHHIRRLDTFLPLLDVFFRLLARREHDVWDRDARCVVAGDHGGVACCCDFEGCVGLGGEVYDLFGLCQNEKKGVSLSSRCKITCLSTPTKPNNRPLLNTLTLPQLLHNLRNARQRLWRRGLRVEELAQLLLVLVGLRRVPRDIGGLALEEIGHEDLVRVVFVRVG
jgi:hypothetical protein